MSAILGGLSVNQFANAMGRGMADIATGALVCGFARGIMVVLTDGNIIHTILHATANVLMKLPSVISAIGMYIFQCLLNFVVPSGKRTGGSIYANHGAAFGPGRCYKTDSHIGIPIGRWHFQHLYADVGIFHGGTCSGKDSMGKMGKMDSAFDRSAIPAGCGSDRDCTSDELGTILS